MSKVDTVTLAKWVQDLEVTDGYFLAAFTSAYPTPEQTIAFNAARSTLDQLKQDIKAILHG